MDQWSRALPLVWRSSRHLSCRFVHSPGGEVDGFRWQPGSVPDGGPGYVPDRPQGLEQLNRFRLEMQQSLVFQKNVQGVPTSRDREAAAAKSKGKARARGRPKAGRAASRRQSLHRRDRGQIACGHGVLTLRHLRLQFQRHLHLRAPECLLPCP